MTRSLFAAPLFLIFLSSSAYAEDALSDKTLLLKKADEALATFDRKGADFYAARYMGLCAREGAGACPDDEMAPYLKKRKYEPKGFLPASWDPEFLEWFEASVRERWGAPSERVREKARSLEITQAIFRDSYYVTVVAHPYIEQWYTLKDGLASQPFLLTLGGYRDHPTIFFGKLLKGQSVQSYPIFLDTNKRALHYVWKPEFHDVDRDGLPEVWIRFNLAWDNGFMQVLEVYKMRADGRPELLHHFQGDPNGYARRLEDGSVELAGLPRFSRGKYRVETWVLENKSYKKSGQKEFLLPDSSDWPPAISWN